MIPIAQWGAQRILGRYKKLLKPFPPKTVTVVAGPPVDLSDLYGRPQDAATLREWAKARGIAVADPDHYSEPKARESATPHIAP